MWKLKLGVIVIGCIIVFKGFQEFKVSWGTTKEPLAIELPVLEQGTASENNHLKIGEHFALLPYAVYEYERRKGETGDPTATSKVNHAYYPIISYQHPYIGELVELAKKYGALTDIPDEEWPTMQSFAVLVKTQKFNTIGEIPDEWEENPTVQGWVINRIQRLDAEEKRLIQESFPTINLDTVCILEEHRTPSSIMKSIGMMVGGGVLSLIGLGLFAISHQKDKGHPRT